MISMKGTYNLQDSWFSDIEVTYPNQLFIKLLPLDYVINKLSLKFCDYDDIK